MRFFKEKTALKINWPTYKKLINLIDSIKNRTNISKTKTRK